MTIDRDLREIVIRAFVENLRELGFSVVVGSASGRRAHALVELPDDRGQVRRIIGKCKERASHAVRDFLAGSIWAEGGEYKLVNDDSHYGNAFYYIPTKQEPDALVWSVAEGRTGSTRFRGRRIRVFAEAQTPAWCRRRRLILSPAGV